MKKSTFTKKALALFLAIAMVLTGLYIPKSNVRIVNAEDETEAIEVVEEGTEEVIPEDAVAKMGNEYYMSLDEALTAAKASDSAVTITLVKNIVLDNAATFDDYVFFVKNENGKKITIDGKNCTITAGTNVKKLFSILTEFELKNVIVDYKGTYATIQINAPITTSLTNVIINAENIGLNANSYLKDAIIDVYAAGEHTLNLTNTNITVIGPEGKDLNSTFYPIIRTNAGLENKDTINHKTRIVTMNLTNSTLDASAAVGRLGIWVTRGTIGNVILDNSHIKTTYGKGTSTVENRTIYGQIVSNVALDDKVILTGGSTLTCTNGKADPFNFITCVARIGNQFHETFADAVAAANTATENVTLEFFDDITIGGDTPSSETGNAQLTNTNDIEITIDGHGHKVYTKAKHSISIRRSGTVNLQNMKIEHTGYQSALQVAASDTTSNAITAVVNVTDVDFTVNNTSDGNIALYGLILIPNRGSTTINFVGSDVTMTTTTPANTQPHGILRTGNGNSKNVSITLNDCNWNATAATKRKGIVLMAGAQGSLTLTNTTIHTGDDTPIYDNSASGVEITKTKATLTCDSKEAQIGNELKTFSEAISAVNSSASNITVEILNEISTTSQITFRNNNNGVVSTVSTFDGNGHTITIEGTGNNSIVIFGSVDGTGTYEFKNMDFVHGRKGVLIQLNKEDAVVDEETGEVTTPAHTSKQTIVKLTNVDITNTSNGGYLYGLITTLPTGEDANMTLDLNKVNVTLTFNSDSLETDVDGAVIRTGNNNAKNVIINLNKCNFNLENAAKIRGIRVTNSSNATINMTDSDIITKNVAPIEANTNAGSNNTITFTGNCTLDSKTEGYKTAPIRGYDAQVGNKVYRTFATAIAEAGAGATVEVLQNLSTGWRDITKSMTIDGNGYEIKSTAGDENNKFLFVVKGDATEFTLKDLNIKHLRRGMVVRTDIPTTVTLEKVNIDATEAPVSTEYALFNLTAAGTTNLIWNDVTVDMDATTAGLDDNPAIIRTGNDGTKNINITLTDCDLNTEGAAGRHGIVIMSGATATLNLTETTITTLDVVPIKDNTGNATINTTDCTLTYTGIEAIIGDNLYKTFAEALEAANESKTDVTLEIMKDISIGAGNTLANENGKSITIEGHNHVLTATGGQHTFMITTTQVGTVEFKNMTIKHQNKGSAIQIADSITGEKLAVTLTDVTINATESPDGYDHAIINVLKKNTTDLVMTDVTITMSTELAGSANSPFWGIIRTGNQGTNNAKNVNMTLTNCTLNSSGATGRHGIVVVANTTANIVLENTTIKSKDVAPIKNHATTSQTITLDNVTFESLAERYQETPIEGYEAQVNDVVYGKFGDARLAANEAEESVTLKLLSELTVTQNVYINNANGKTITFDGNGYNVTTAGGSNNHAFLIGKACTVKFENMTVYHKNRGSFVQVSENLDEVRLSLEHITILATNPENEASNYNYALINIFSSATVNLTDVTVDMDATNSGADPYPGIIRTGNTGTVQKVDITLNECTLDTTGATGRHGIIIMKSTTATVNLLDTTITTMNAAPIVDYSTIATISRDEETTTSCNDEKYVAYVEGNVYETFAEVLTAANTATGKVILGLLQPVSVEAANIGNTKGKIIVDGNTHKIITENGNHAFSVNKNAEVEFRNMTIEHKRYGSAIQVTEDGAGATLTLTDVFLDAKYPPQVKQSDGSYINTYNYALINLMTSSTLNMTNSRAIMVVDALGAGGGNQSSIIRTGNQDDDKDDAVYKEITINLTDCILDTTSATNRSGILVVDAKTDINLKGITKILTQAGDKCAAIRGLEGTRVAKISMEETCLLQTGESTAYADVIKNVEERITDACTWTYKQYNNLSAFRTESGLKAPTTVPTGYVFAGWYSNKACTAEYALAADDLTTTSAYAKFVPDHVIDVKAQLSADLLDGLTDGEKGAIRFVTTVDSLDYTEVGFDYIIQISDTVSKTGTVHSSTVYKTLCAVGDKTSGPISYTPDEAFCGVSQYFKAITIKNIPQSAFGAEITVTPFWVTLDGTKVYGEPATKSVNQGIEAADSEGNVTEDSENTGSVYTNRVVMVSDLHYTTSLVKEIYDKENWSFGAWLSKKLPNASWAAGNAFGYTQEQKLQAALDDINAFGAKNTLDAVMVLGDLTLDDYGYRNLVDNYLDDFKLNFMDKLSPSYATYAIAGNHDSYTNAEWKNTIGTDRQYSVVIGDAVFIMLDTFAAQHATGGNGSAYVGVDIDFLRTELQKAEYVDKTIFLCSHYYQQGENSENDTALNALIANDDRVVCMFRAHTHKNVVGTPSALAGSPLVDIGGYAYNGQQEDDGSYEFNTFDKSWAWGYQVVEWNESEVHIYHVKSARKYTDCNGIEHNYKGAIEGDMVIKIGE